MAVDAKRLLRLVVREVHPDRYTKHPEAVETNAEALKELNAYVDAPKEARRRLKLEFLVRRGKDVDDAEGDSSEDLVLLNPVLEERGTLAPLFRAFGLLSEEEVWAWEETPRDDRDLVVWLKEVVEDATKAAVTHDRMRSESRRLCRSVERELDLEELSLGGAEFSSLGDTQRKNLELLYAFQDMARKLSAEARTRFRGVRVCLCQPENHRLPKDKPCMIGSDGTLFLLVCDELCDYLQGFEGQKLLLASRMGDYWRDRVENLSQEIQAMLSVDSVVVDHSWEPGAMGPQKFSMWARRMLAYKESFDSQLLGRHIPITVLVHDDFCSPLIDHAMSSSVIQVRSDCAPQRLLEFLLTTSTEELIQTATEAQHERKNMEALLDQVRDAFKAKYVVSVLSNTECGHVVSACNRLLENSNLILQKVDLSGTSLCIDDSYDAWDNGFISIPYNFQTGDLQVRLRKLLPPGKSRSEDACAPAPRAFLHHVVPPKKDARRLQRLCCICERATPKQIGRRQPRRGVSNPRSKPFWRLQLVF